MEMQKESSYGPVVGLVVIILIIALGSVYFLQDREESQLDVTDTEPVAEVQEQEMQSESLEDISSQSSSDELNAIEEDLNNTNLDSLDASFDDLGV